MKIIFIFPIFESLGVEYLSAYLKNHGHQTELLIDPLLFENYTLPIKFLTKVFNYREKLISEIISVNPDLVCLSTVSDYFNWGVKLAEDIKDALNVPIVFGGSHPTLVPEIVIKNSFIDFVIVGEGEEALLELANNLANGKDVTNIRNVWCKVDGRIIKNPVRPLISDLDSLPFPDKDLYYNHRWSFINNAFGLDNTYTIIASRGCPNVCSYCCNNYMQKLYRGSRYLRFRSADNIIKELITAKERYNFKTVSFWDDLFTANKEWLMVLLKRYKEEISLPFVCYSHPSFLDKETAQFLEYAGCRMIDLGIQSINESLRKNILLRYESNSEIINAIKLISSTKIFLCIDLIAGLPTETTENLLNTAEFFNKYKVNLIFVFWLRHFPKTDITKYLDRDTIEKIDEGIIYAPYQLGGTSFSTNKAKLINLIIVANFVPNLILRFMLKSKLYLLFPRKNFHYANAVLSAILTKIFYPTKYIFPPLRLTIEYLRYYTYYISKFF